MFISGSFLKVACFPKVNYSSFEKLWLTVTPSLLMCGSLKGSIPSALLRASPPFLTAHWCFPPGLSHSYATAGLQNLSFTTSCLCSASPRAPVRALSSFYTLHLLPMPSRHFKFFFCASCQLLAPKPSLLSPLPALPEPPALSLPGSSLSSCKM